MAKPEEQAPAHHRLGPSASSRWLNCPGSVKATAHIEDTATEFAAEGSVAHLVTEWVREQGKPASHFIGREVEQDGFKFTIDQEMADYCQSFVDFCEAHPGDVFVEVKVSMDPWIPGGFGRADDVRVDQKSKTIYVTDLKYGRGVEVKAKGNSQAKLYALGVYNTLGWMYGVDESWSIVNTIYQPRIGNISQDDPISVADLIQWADEVVAPAAKLAASDGAPFKAGSWCKFCKINGTCSERARLMQEEHLADFAVLKEEAQMGVEMDNEQMGRILDMAGQIRNWLSDVENAAMQRCQAGNPPVGADGAYKIVTGRSSRDWRDPVQAQSVLIDLVGEENLWVKKMASPAQIEKVVGKKNETVAELVETKDGKPTLAPASDKRQAVSYGDDLEAL